MNLVSLGSLQHDGVTYETQPGSLKVKTAHGDSFGVELDDGLYHINAAHEHIGVAFPVRSESL